jgi:maltooligosyltrehalose trehalohydrolase
MLDYTQPKLGATQSAEGEWTFCVWCPYADGVELHLLSPVERLLPMRHTEDGYYTLTLPDITPGTPYRYRIHRESDYGDYPDPASRQQVDTVHGASVVVDSRYDWKDSGWFNLPLSEYVIYELHVGTFSAAGTFEAIIPALDDLKALGVTALEIMPIAQFPGGRNWGYDGVLPYAVQNTYGDAKALRRLVEACHLRGMAVILDVVYNHLGAEGNYLWQYGPYFTERYQSPWGASLNFDGADSDEVRRYFIQNAIYWLDEFHIDGFRLDATHALFDFSAVPFLEDLTASVHAWADAHNRRVYLIAENDRADAKLIRAREAGGTGLDAVWLDDLHHSLHVLLTGEDRGYYSDFVPFDRLAKTLRDGFVLDGAYSHFHQRHYGTSSRGMIGSRFVVSTQNHDQVGNRMLGERLSALTDFPGLKLAAGLVLLSPYVPLLFMGEEYGETAPFLYFVSHGDAALVESVRKGRAAEFAYFGWRQELPDPQAEDTFMQSRLNPALREGGWHKTLYEFYRTLLDMRRTLPALRIFDKSSLDVTASEQDRVLLMRRRGADPHDDLLIAYNLNLTQPITVQPPLTDGQTWRKIFDSAASEWQRADQPESASAADTLNTQQRAILILPPKSFAVYRRDIG